MPGGFGPQAGLGRTALMNHPAGSRSPAEVHTGEGRGGGTSTMASGTA